MAAPQAYPEGAVIHNPSTGQTMVMQGGKWIDQGTSQMARTLAPADEAELAKNRDQVNKTRQIVDLAGQFGQLNAQQDTGGVARVLPGAVSLEGTFNPKIRAMDSLTKQMIPLQREVGSGPIRMGEIQGPDGGIWGGDVPTVKAPGDANALIRQQWQGKLSIAQNRAAFLDAWTAKNGTLNGSEAGYDQYHQAEQANVPNAQQIAGYGKLMAAGQIDRSQPKGAQSNPYLAVSPGIAQRLPAGSYYLDGQLQLQKAGAPPQTGRMQGQGFKILGVR